MCASPRPAPRLNKCASRRTTTAETCTSRRTVHRAAFRRRARLRAGVRTHPCVMARRVAALRSSSATRQRLRTRFRLAGTNRNPSDPARVLLQPERRTAVDMTTVRSVEIEVHDAAGAFKVVHEPESAVVPSHVALWRPFGELRVRRACAALMHHFYGLGQPSTDGHLYALTGVALALQAVAAGSDAEAAVDAEHLGAQLLAVCDVGAAVARARVAAAHRRGGFDGCGRRRPCRDDVPHAFCVQDGRGRRRGVSCRVVGCGS